MTSWGPFPVRTRHPRAVGTLRRAQRPPRRRRRRRWIKEAGGSVDRVDQRKQALGSDITVLSGDDVLTLPFMAAGAEGVISVVSNLLVREVGGLVKLALENDFAAAGKVHRKLYAVFKAMFIEPNPVPIKAALARAGIIGSDEVRLPLCEMSAPNRAILEGVLGALGK